jgi:hypothetical protein
LTLWQHTAAGWAELSPGTFRSISGTHPPAGPGVLYGVLTDGELWKHDPVTGWAPLFPGGSAASAAP